MDVSEGRHFSPAQKVALKAEQLYLKYALQVLGVYMQRSH